MAFFVYVLECLDGSFYTGYTKNVEKRMKMHENGKGARYTRMHKPQRIVYVEPFDSRARAMKREKCIKRMNHLQKLKIINAQNSNL